MDDQELAKISISLLKLIYNGKSYKSTILNHEIVFSLLENIECKYKVAESWNLVYSTAEHGFSLKTMVSNLIKIEPPFIFSCKENSGNIFGVFINDKICFRSSPCGKQSTFLFKVENNKTKIFKFSGKSPYFCLCSPSFIGFGCSDGKFGLLLDATLLTGTSSRVVTFNNEILSKEEKFNVRCLEVWSVDC